MVQTEVTTLRNRGGALFFLMMGIALFTLGLIPLVPIIIAIQGPVMPTIVGACVILSISLLILARIVPFRVGISDAAVILKGPLGGRGKVVQIQDVAHAQYRITQRGLGKPLGKRLYIIDIGMRHSSARRIVCDGLVAERLLTILRGIQVTLIITSLGGATIEERRILSQSDIR